MPVGDSGDPERQGELLQAPQPGSDRAGVLRVYQRSEVGPENGSEQPSWSQDTKPEGMVAGGWSVSIPEEGTACVKSETVQAWYFSRLALQSV